MRGELYSSLIYFDSTIDTYVIQQYLHDSGSRLVCSKIIFSYVKSPLNHLFYFRNLTPATVSAYKSALVRPLRLIFNIDVTSPPFPEFLRAFYNIRPSKPMGKLSWSLDKVLELALSPRFQVNPSVLDSLMLTAFLISLATGARISELHALLRSSDFISFEDSGVTIFPNPNFYRKKRKSRGKKKSHFY